MIPSPMHSIDARRPRLIAAALALSFGALVCVAASSPPQLVPVRHPQGSLHGFLVLRSLDGTAVADGDLIQSVAADRVTARTVFHFRDGSVDDETAVFSQRGTYRLVSDHLVQSGPTFEHPLSMDLDVAGGRVVVHTKGDRGEDKVDDEHMPLPADVANGLLITLLGEVETAQLPLTGDEPVFVKSEAPMYPGGPILRTELASPKWPR